MELPSKCIDILSTYTLKFAEISLKMNRCKWLGKLSSLNFILRKTQTQFRKSTSSIYDFTSSSSKVINRRGIHAIKIGLKVDTIDNTQSRCDCIKTTYADIGLRSLDIETVGLGIEVAVFLERQIDHITDLVVITPCGVGKPDLLSLGVVFHDELQTKAQSSSTGQCLQKCSIITLSIFITQCRN